MMLGLKCGGWGCRVLTDELEQTRSMLQNLQDSLVLDDGLQVKVALIICYNRTYCYLTATHCR